MPEHVEKRTTELFENEKNYVLGDPELEVIGSKQKLAYWRHMNKGPPYYKLGRKIIYVGVDLNSYARARRIVPAA